MKSSTRLLLAFSSLCLTAPPALAELSRRAPLGVSMAPERQTGQGVTVTGVIPNATASVLGVREGDIIIRAGDQAVITPPQLSAYAATLIEGARASLVVRRNGRETTLSGTAVARPLESFAGATTDYGAVPFDGGELRDILVMPQGRADAPVVYLIQGFSCATMENPDYHRLGEELIRDGIGFYRVEKPGIGDSAGGRPCTAIDYATELDSFRTAYRHLVERRGVPADRVFMLGHSLGGLQAPMLAAEAPPRGVAVFGTVFRNWADYHRDLVQFQPFLLTGGDLAAHTEQADNLRDAIRRFYFGRETPAQIVAGDPPHADAFRAFFSSNGVDTTYGRHFRYMQDLAHLPLIAAWRDARTNVLSIYGEADVVALFDTDHKLIAEFVNNQRPGTARYIEIPRTYHGMDLVGTRDELRTQMVARGTPPQGEFNPEVARALSAWIREAMARPPVREQFPTASG